MVALLRPPMACSIYTVRVRALVIGPGNESLANTE
jgi:hypothetical protein